MDIKILNILFIFISFLNKIVCSSQYGPDPWHCESNSIHNSDSSISPYSEHLSITKALIDPNIAQKDWFLKRIIAIVLKGGMVKRNEKEGTVQIYMHMKFPEEQWNLLNDYTQYNQAFTDEMLRRTIGYIDDAIYKPSLTEKITQAWSDYIQEYLSIYKVEIKWTLIIISVMTIIGYLSRKHMLILSFFGIYAYEACISYMESEKEEYAKFMKAVNTCKWYFWSSDCNLPQPDPLMFLKHMHPLKIGIRIITTFMTEPIINFSSTIQTVVHGITDDLWYPLNSIVYGILTVFLIIVFIALLFIFVIVIFSNFLLNIPINLSLLGNFINIGMLQRKRQVFTETSILPGDINSNDDTLSSRNSKKFIVTSTQCADKLEKPVKPSVSSISKVSRKEISLKRSFSTGRVPELCETTLRLPCNIDEKINSHLRNKHKNLGSGDN